MLERVINPQQGKVTFGYDALGRRVYKEVKHTRTCWLWDGNVPLHEWRTTEKEPLTDIITWVFEEGTFVPAARITDGGSQSIITDYLGTPVQMFDAKGEKTWEVNLDIYGKVRTSAGRSLSDCPFRYQVQYEDAETGLYYNRFRYYDPDAGNYISQDPIRLDGNNPNMYGYVYDTNSELDIVGLSCKKQVHHIIPNAVYRKFRKQLKGTKGYV
jgi:RHS repeat-associated protein